MKAYLLPHLVCGECGQGLAEDADTGAPKTYRVVCCNSACNEYGKDYLWEAPEVVLKEMP